MDPMRYNPAQAQPTTNIPPAQGSNQSPYILPQQPQRNYLPPGVMMAPRGYGPTTTPQQAMPSYYAPMMMVPTANPQIMMQRPQMAPVRQLSSSSTSSMPTPSPLSLSLYPTVEDYNDLLGDPRLYDDNPDSGANNGLGRKVRRWHCSSSSSSSNSNSSGGRIAALAIMYTLHTIY